MTGVPDNQRMQAVKAGLWVISSKLAAKLVDFVSLLVLARLLGPADFGLVAIAMTAIFIVEAIFELPLSSALIRLADLTDDMFRTAFTLGLLRGASVGLVLVLLSWPIAALYRDPRLAELVCVLALAPMMRGLISPRMVIYARKLDFRPEVAMEVAGKAVAAAVAMTIAVSTGSYWAIAASTVLSPVVMMIVSYCLAPMRPGLTLRQWPIFSGIIGWSMLSQLISSITWQADRLILPRFIDTRSFGRYTISSDLVSIPFQAVLYPLSRPLFAALARTGQDGGLGKAYLKVCGGVFLLMSPMFAFMICMAEPIVTVLLGSKWIEATPVFQALCFTAILGLPGGMMWIFAFLLNRLKMVTVRLLVELLAYIPLALIGVTWWGLAGAIVAKMATAIIAAGTGMALIQSFVGARIRDQVLAIYRAMFANLLTIAVLYYTVFAHVSAWPPVVQIGVSGVLYLTLYGCLVYLLWVLARRPDSFETLLFRAVSHYAPVGAWFRVRKFG